MTAPGETRTCERCSVEYTRNRDRETRTRFATRKFCTTACRIANIRRVGVPKPVTLTAQARIVNGVWRPNAPGFPDIPGGAA